MSEMKKMVGFGDYMLRLNPEGYLRFLQADRFLVNYTGAEANVCVSLAMMGMDTDFVTRLPENDIAAAGVAQLRKSAWAPATSPMAARRHGRVLCGEGGLSAAL